jgi:hypothetical protein
MRERESIFLCWWVFLVFMLSVYFCVMLHAAGRRHSLSLQRERESTGTSTR